MTTSSSVESNAGEITRELGARLAATCDHALIESAEHRWPAELWTSLREDGFASVGCPEEFGGSGGSVVDACAVLQSAGYHAAPVPLAESGLLNGWLAKVIGGPTPDGFVSIAPTADLRLAAGGATVSGTAHRVPWGRVADHVGVVTAGPEPAVVILDCKNATVRESANFAGEPRDDLAFDGASPVALVQLEPQQVFDLRVLGGLTRAALSAGAVERLADLTIRYTSERRQFGKPVGSFQAVQQHIVAVVEMTALLKISVHGAAAAVDAGDGRYEVAAAKVMASRAATLATRAAHQAHGAMGMTREYPLHQYSRRLWSWATEYGDEREWTDFLGRAVFTVGADGLYPFITNPRVVGQAAG